MKTTKFTSLVSRLLIVALVFTLLSSALVFPTFAEEKMPTTEQLTISEDYKSAQYNGKNYLTVPDNFYYSEYYNTHKTIPSDSIILSEEQSKNIGEVYAYTEDMYLYVQITYKYGNTHTFNYIDSQYWDTYEKFYKGHGDTVEISILDSFRSNLEASYDALLGEKLTVPGYEIYYYYQFGYVFSYNDEIISSKTSGMILRDGEGNYYFLDYYQKQPAEVEDLNNVDTVEQSFENYEEIELYKITNQELITKLRDNDSSLVTDDDIVWDDNSEEFMLVVLIISAIILSILFALIPFAVMVACLIISFMAKKPYKTLLRVITLVCAIELVLFSIVFLLLLIL